MITPSQASTLEAFLALAIERIGDNPNREGLEKTPARVVDSWKELFAGYEQDPEAILSTVFEDTKGYDQMVILKDTEFYSTCEHHMLPFFGVAHVAYIPGDKVVGVSKLARLVECFARRLQIQESMTQEIADTLFSTLNPKGVAVILEAQHFCMTSRGVKKQRSKMVTSALKGAFQKNEVRAEFLRLVRGPS